MALAQRLFLLEVAVDGITSAVAANNLTLKAEFHDITLDIPHVAGMEITFPNAPSSTKSSKSSKKSKSKKDKSSRTKKVQDLDEWQKKTWSPDHCRREEYNSSVRAGQSILFPISPDVLVSKMSKHPLVISLWNREFGMTYIGQAAIIWDSSFYKFVEKITPDLETQSLSNSVINRYNIYDDDHKIVAYIDLSIKLSFYKDRITTKFKSSRAKGEDDTTKFCYRSSGVDATYKSELKASKKQDLKTRITRYKHFDQQPDDFSFCCVNNKTPAFLKKSRSLPDLDEMAENIRDLISNCRKTLRQLTTRSVIKPKVRAIDAELARCNHCSGTGGAALPSTCPICKFNAGDYDNAIIEQIKGPCGNPDCSFALMIKQYLDLIRENEEKIIEIDEVTGPCGRLDCVLAQRIRKFLKGDEVFSPEKINKELSYVCNCMKILEGAIDHECREEKDNEEKPNEATALVQITSETEIEINEIIGACGSLKCGLAEQVRRYLFSLLEGEPCVEECQPCDTLIPEADCRCALKPLNETKYCIVCGGYLVEGDDLKNLPPYAIKVPPCPVFNRLMIQKGIIKTERTVAVGMTESILNMFKNCKRKKRVRTGKTPVRKNVGYKKHGPPRVVDGHKHCVPVRTYIPKNQGWLWNATNVPGMEYRENWRPGACDQRVVSLLKKYKNAGSEPLKPSSKVKISNKDALPKPAIKIEKKDGDIIVNVQPMKDYTKPREATEYPYEYGPSLKYKIGEDKSPLEVARRQEKKSREKRRLIRRRYNMITSMFKNRCKEMCWKTYHQAFGSPIDPNDPECRCGPDDVDISNISLDSCSCASNTTLSEMRPDNHTSEEEDWTVEFSPPAAKYTPKNNIIRKYLDHQRTVESQYKPEDLEIFEILENIPRPLNQSYAPNTTTKDRYGVDTGISRKRRDKPKGYIPGVYGRKNFREVCGLTSADRHSGSARSSSKGRSKSGSSRRCRNRKTSPFASTTSNLCRGKSRAMTTQEKIAGGRLPKDNWSCFGNARPEVLAESGVIGHGKDKKALLSKRGPPHFFSGKPAPPRQDYTRRMRRPIGANFPTISRQRNPPDHSCHACCGLNAVGYDDSGKEHHYADYKSRCFALYCKLPTIANCMQTSNCPCTGTYFRTSEKGIEYHMNYCDDRVC